MAKASFMNIARANSLFSMLLWGLELVFVDCRREDVKTRLFCVLHSYYYLLLFVPQRWEKINMMLSLSFACKGR